MVYDEHEAIRKFTKAVLYAVGGLERGVTGPLDLCSTWPVVGIALVFSVLQCT